MQYRKFGKTKWQISALALGVDALPTGKAPSIKIVSRAIEQGVNFIDLGWPFAGGRGEFIAAVLAKALEGNRDNVKIAVSVPSLKIHSAEDFNECLEFVLNQFSVVGVDFITLGGLDRRTWPAFYESGAFKAAETALAAGKFERLGFFFHDQYRFLRDVIAASSKWSYAQFRYSFMDIDHHPGATGLQLAASQGLGVIVNQPLLGGRLVTNIPPAVEKIWAKALPARPPAEWALRWDLNHGDISSVVSDVSNLTQLKQNLAVAESALADGFSVTEELVLSRARDAYRARKPILCTACRGCMPCPNGIDAPRIFEIYNEALMYDDVDTARAIFLSENHDLSNCMDCGACSGKCGFHIPIAEWLKKARVLFEEE
jgi:uncharacterized protein